MPGPRTTSRRHVEGVCQKSACSRRHDSGLTCDRVVRYVTEPQRQSCDVSVNVPGSASFRVQLNIVHTPPCAELRFFRDTRAARVPRCDVAGDGSLATSRAHLLVGPRGEIRDSAVAEDSAGAPLDGRGRTLDLQLHAVVSLVPIPQMAPASSRMTVWKWKFAITVQAAAADCVTGDVPYVAEW